MTKNEVFRSAISLALKEARGNISKENLSIFLTELNKFSINGFFIPNRVEKLREVMISLINPRDNSSKIVEEVHSFLCLLQYHLLDLLSTDDSKTVDEFIDGCGFRNEIAKLLLSINIKIDDSSRYYDGYYDPVAAIATNIKNGSKEDEVIGRDINTLFIIRMNMQFILDEIKKDEK